MGASNAKTGDNANDQSFVPMVRGNSETPDLEKEIDHVLQIGVAPLDKQAKNVGDEDNGVVDQEVELEVRGLGLGAPGESKHKLKGTMLEGSVMQSH